jgi:hypothetical protein
MPAHSVFEYAVIRVVPRVERGECINAGVVLFCRTRRFLAARISLDETRLRVLAPDIDLPALREQLEHIPRVCAGGPAAGVLGELPAHERFRWLTAPRSTIVQPSPVHCGLTDDPSDELDRLVAALVR